MVLGHLAGTLVPCRPGRGPSGPLLGLWRERRPLVLAPSPQQPRTQRRHIAGAQTFGGKNSRRLFQSFKFKHEQHAPDSGPDFFCV